MSMAVAERPSARTTGAEITPFTLNSYLPFNPYFPPTDPADPTGSCYALGVIYGWVDPLNPAANSAGWKPVLVESDLPPYVPPAYVPPAP